MVVEAQWDRPNVPARAQVTALPRGRLRGENDHGEHGIARPLHAGLSRRGFALRDFLHEGNGDIWLAALDGPRPYAGWVLIEEKAEGGDMLAQRARENPAFLDGFTRVCEGAGLALYRRQRIRRSDRHSEFRLSARRRNPESAIPTSQNLTLTVKR